MPGIFGIVSRQDRQDIFQKMRSTAYRASWFDSLSETVVSDDGSRAELGVTGLQMLEETPLTQMASSGEWTVVFYGEIYNPEDFQEYSAQGKWAEMLLNGFREKGSAFLAQVDGRYHVAFWNRREETLTLATDHFATRPLYWMIRDGDFLFAPCIKSLFEYPGMRIQWDRFGVIQFYVWGQYLQEATAIENIHPLPPAGCYTLSLKTGEVRKEIYYRFHSEEDSGVTVDDVAEAFHAAVLRQTKGTQLLGVSLSGGLDARSILGMLPPEQLAETTTVSLGVPGSADLCLASEMAKLAGTRHFNYELNTDFLDRYGACQEEMVRLTDAHYLSSSIVIPTLSFYREQGIQTLLRGHAGELFHMSKAYAFSLEASDLHSFSGPQSQAHRQRLEEWAYSHLQAFLMQNVKGKLFAGFVGMHLEEYSREAMRQILQDAGLEQHADVAQTVWHLYLRQRVAREISMSMRKFDAYVNVRLPILDRRLLELLFRLPVSMKMGETIQKRILEKYRPDFLRVKNVNTGTYIGAGSLRQKVAGLQQRAMAKFGFPGYQPYEKMGLWLRRELREYVQNTILNSEFLDSGFYNPDVLRNIVQEHNDGINHTYLILALTIVARGIKYFNY
ncbi:MAG: asparagine synthase-related protein [Planctomycetia bacterium]|nr:asparagine synthase-related protein [Planctomycetia bacterium]